MLSIPFMLLVCLLMLATILVAETCKAENISFLIIKIVTLDGILFFHILIECNGQDVLHKDDVYRVSNRAHNKQLQC
jgi:hypothetical protein